MTPERAVKNKVVRLLTSMGVYWFYPVQAGFGRAGIPDVVCCFKGHFLAIECKAGKNTTTALQEKELQAIRDAGGTAIVINESNIYMLEDMQVLDNVLTLGRIRNG